MAAFQPTPVEAYGGRTGPTKMSFASAVASESKPSDPVSGGVRSAQVESTNPIRHGNGMSSGANDSLRLSFASAVSKSAVVPRFQPIPLASRQYGVVDGKPSVHFTVAEFDAGAALFRFSLIAKFTVGRPSIAEIREVFKAHWTIKGRATVSDIWDGRHVMIILDSEEDATTALTCPLRKIGHAMFRLFRYTADYNPKKESSYTSKWVRLPGIHPAFMTRNYVASIVNSFGYFLDLDDRTKVCSSMRYARACVEIDVSQPIPDEVQITLSDGRKFWQKMEVEGNLSYCSHCNIHGHALATCRKKRSIKVNVDTKEKATILKAATTNDKITTTTEKTTTSCPRKNGMNDPIKEQEWQVVNRKKKGKGKMEDFVQPLKEQDDNVAAEERIQDPRPIIPLLPELIVPQEVMVKTAATSTAMVLYTESQFSERVEENLQDSQQSQTQGAKAIIVHHEYDTKQSSVPARNSHDDESTDPGTAVVGIDQRTVGVTNDSISLVEKSSADMQIPEEFVQKLSSYGDQIYCARIGGSVEPKALFLHLLEKGESASNIFLFLDEAQQEGSNTPFEESENQDVQCEAVVPSKVPNVPTPKKFRQRKKKGTRSSARSCPKQKDKNFVWT